MQELRWCVNNWCVPLILLVFGVFGDKLIAIGEHGRPIMAMFACAKC